MKYISVLVLTLLSSIVIAQVEGVIWDSQMSVSDGSVYGRVRPRIALTANDVPVILYGKQSGLYVSRWNGTGFDLPVSILPVGMQTYIADWTGPDIAAKGDTVIVVFKAMPIETGNVYSVRSVDGGQTFSDTIRVDAHDNAVAWLPSLDITSNGDPVVSYMIHDANWTNPRYVLARSSDAGLNYVSEINVVTGIPGEACDCCPSEMVIEGAYEVLLFRNNDVNLREMYAVMSEDQGTTFPYYSNVDLSGWVVNSCPSTGPHGTIVNNKLLTVFATGASGNYRVAVSESSIGAGLIYDTTFQNNDPSQNRNFPRISGSQDTVVMTWRQYSGPQSDIYVSVLIGTDYSILLSEGFQACEDETGVQTNPDIIYRNGKVHLCFQDNYAGDVMYRSGVIGEVSGVEQIENMVSLYPNPSNTGELVIPEGYEFQSLVDSQGKEIAISLVSVETGERVVLQEPKSGIYFLRLQTQSGKSMIYKWIINN